MTNWPTLELSVLRKAMMRGREDESWPASVREQFVMIAMVAKKFRSKTKSMQALAHLKEKQTKRFLKTSSSEIFQVIGHSTIRKRFVCSGSSAVGLHRPTLGRPALRKLTARSLGQLPLRPTRNTPTTGMYVKFWLIFGCCAWLCSVQPSSRLARRSERRKCNSRLERCAGRRTSFSKL